MPHSVNKIFLNYQKIILPQVQQLPRFTWPNLNLLNSDIIETTYGSVSGLTKVSRNGSKYHAFRGIPYAKPPVGEFRFKDPYEPESWTGVRKAEQYSAACPQSGWDGRTYSGDEDCLYINVFTPLVANIKLPVMVWIYGGGFTMGESTIYGPDYIMDKSVVFVTFNYRLGALGFLCANDKELLGNYGMKDQVAALNWVQKNIAAFGGDPSQVTIAGSSAGGASVNWHMHSEMSKGLFHRAISQSGTAMSVWNEIPQLIAKRRALTFATLAGCNFKSTKEIVKCLRKIPVGEIITIQKKMKIWKHNPSLFGIVKNKFHGSFAKESPWNTDRLVNEVPWLVGFTSDEGAGLITGLLDNNGTDLEFVNSNRYRILPLLLLFDYFDNVKTVDDIIHITDAVKSFYFGDDDISYRTVEKLKNMVADSYLIYDITESLFKFKGKKFLYVYDHINEHSFAEFDNNIVKEKLRAVHCDDLISLFKTTYFPQDLNPVDREVSEKIVTLWTNFVIYGDPNDPGNSTLIWKPVSTELGEIEYLLIKKDVEMKSWNWKDRYLFWKSLKLRRSHEEVTIMDSCYAGLFRL